MAMHHLSYHSITSTHHPKMHLKKYQGGTKGGNFNTWSNYRGVTFQRPMWPMFEWVFTMIVSFSENPMNIMENPSGFSSLKSSLPP